LVVASRWLLHPAVPQPAGSLVYELAAGHPDRHAGQLIFPADLTAELRAWPAELLGSARRQPEPADRRSGQLLAARRHRRPHVPAGTRGGPAGAGPPGDDLAREGLRERLEPLMARAWRRWLHPTSGRRPGERFL
jgi:hypothetical protein